VQSGMSLDINLERSRVKEEVRCTGSVTNLLQQQPHPFIVWRTTTEDQGYSEQDKY